MRTFELTTRMDEIRRREGRSATASAAYISGTDIHCEREDKTHAYRRKGGVAFSAIFLPETAPAAFKDRAALWNAAEAAERNGKRGKNAGQWKAKAQTATTYLFSFPAELSAAGRETAAARVARYLAERDRTAADANIHAPGREGDERNWHCHIQMPTRVLSAKGFGKKAEGRNDLKLARAQAKELRAFIAQTLNEQLKAEGKAHLVKVEHRSFKDRGMQRDPTRHMGAGKTNMQRKERRIARERETEQAAVELATKQAAETRALKLRQERERAAKQAAWRQQWQAHIRKLRAEVRGARQADRGPQGLKKFLLKAVGQLARVEAERQARHRERVAQAKTRAAQMQKILGMEARTFERAQTLARDELEARHSAENRQLGEATQHRAAFDRALERTERQPSQARERQHEQGQELRLEL